MCPLLIRCRGNNCRNFPKEFILVFASQRHDRMALSSSDSSVTIGKETFSLVEIPKVGTELVTNEKTSLLGELDLESFVADVGKLGSFIRVAYNGVAGNTELQIKVQRVGYKITKLTDEAAVTVHKFKQTSQNVLQELQGTYQFLLDGLEEMALENVASLANLAEAMAKVAEELSKKFDEATTDVIDALEDTQRTKGVSENRKKDLQRQREDFESRKKMVEQLQREALEAKEEAERLYEEAQKREDEALEKQDSLLRGVADSIGKIFSATAKLVAIKPLDAREKLSQIGENTAYKEAMQRANTEKLKHLEVMQKQRDIRRDALQDCIEFTEKIRNCKTDEGLEEVAIDALHNSIGALKSLSTIMMNAAVFWRHMQTHCESLAKKDVQNMIERAMKYPEEKRLKVWTSPGFKTKAIHYYSKWVALDDVCGTYMKQIKQTRKDLYGYLQENPTIEQSRKNVRELAASFKEELEKAHEEFAKQESKGKEEKKALGKNEQ